MHVEVDFVDVVVVICSRGKISTEAALRDIAAVDPPSNGVPMKQVKEYEFPFPSPTCFFSNPDAPIHTVWR